MRNPNGYGSITKLPGNRRKPYAIRVSSFEDGVLKRKYVDYYRTSTEARIALAELNKGNIDMVDHTFQDVFNLFREVRYPKISDGQQQLYTYCFNLMQPLHKRKFRDIRTVDLQTIIDSIEYTETKKRTKTVLNGMYRIARERDIVLRDYAEFVNITVNRSKTIAHRVLKRHEIDKLFQGLTDNPTHPYIAYLVILLLTGMRLSELFNIEVKNCDLKERYMIGGMKTEAGEGRTIPLLEFVVPLIAQNMGQKYLFEIDGKKVTKDNIDHRLRKVKKELGLDFRTHDLRKTFITLLRETPVDKLTVQRIVGHKGGDVTDKHYTDLRLKTLVDGIDFLKHHSYFENHLNKEYVSTVNDDSMIPNDSVTNT